MRPHWLLGPPQSVHWMDNGSGLLYYVRALVVHHNIINIPAAHRLIKSLSHL